MKAHDEIEYLRQNGVETDEERATREARALREARWKDREAGAELHERLTLLLELLLNDGNESTKSITAVHTLSGMSSDGRVKIDITEPLASGLPLILAGYEGSRRLFADVATQTPYDERQAVHSILKSVAVELMTDGADIRGLDHRYGPTHRVLTLQRQAPSLTRQLLAGGVGWCQRPGVGSGRRGSHAARGNAPCLHHALPARGADGEAQAYADHLSLTSLSVS